MQNKLMITAAVFAVAFLGFRTAVMAAGADQVSDNSSAQVAGGAPGEATDMSLKGGGGGGHGGGGGGHGGGGHGGWPHGGGHSRWPDHPGWSRWSHPWFPIIYIGPVPVGGYWACDAEDDHGQTYRAYDRFYRDVAANRAYNECSAKGWGCFVVDCQYF